MSKLSGLSGVTQGGAGGQVPAGPSGAPEERWERELRRMAVLQRRAALDRRARRRGRRRTVPVLHV